MPRAKKVETPAAATVGTIPTVLVSRLSVPAADPFDAMASAAVADEQFAAGLKRKRIGPAHVVGVVRGLRRNGFGAVALAAWLPVILELLVTLGPLIAEIIERIRQARDQGETPATFTGRL